jgi:hypothetical protein
VFPFICHEYKAPKIKEYFYPKELERCSLLARKSWIMKRENPQVKGLFCPVFDTSIYSNWLEETVEQHVKELGEFYCCGVCDNRRDFAVSNITNRGIRCHIDTGTVKKVFSSDKSLMNEWLKTVSTIQKWGGIEKVSCVKEYGKILLVEMDNKVFLDDDSYACVAKYLLGIPLQSSIVDAV